MSQAMANYNFSSLVEVLNHQSSQQQPNNGMGNSYEDSYVTEMFGELYFKEVSPPFPLHSLFSPSPFPSSSSLASSLPDPTLEYQTNIQNFNCDANHHKKRKKRNGEQPWESEENKCSYDTKSSWTSKDRLFPPPVSFLKLFKTGKPFSYFKFNDEIGRLVREEIKIPPQGFLRGSRENGCLKLNSAHKEEEEEEDEDEEEEEDQSEEA